MWKPTDRRGSCVCVRARVLTLELTYMCCLTYIFDFESVFVLPRV